MHIPPRSHGIAVASSRTSFAARRMLLPLQGFVHTEINGGLVLLSGAVAALVWANSPFGASYERFWNLEIAFHAGGLTIAHSLRDWINDGLMALFFFVVGTEIKRELVHGELSGWRRASLPLISAVGGMIIPALLYLALNFGTPGARGWGIPMATDIAFALGILALLRDRVPGSARLFLLALATVDDIGAILVIATFYTDHLSGAALLSALVFVALMVIMRKLGVQNIASYIPIAFLVWFFVLESGVHATIAGVALGLLTPTTPYIRKSEFADVAEPLVEGIRDASTHGDAERAEAMLGQVEQLAIATESPADRLVRVLHPWSSYVVLPIFALANAGVRVTSGLAENAIYSPVMIGILIGLCAGKLLGVAGFAFIATRLRIATRLPEVGWMQMTGIGLLAGVGFTVSLFISDLAFGASDTIIQAKAGVLLASVLAGLGGYATLAAAHALKKNSTT